MYFKNLLAFNFLIKWFSKSLLLDKIVGQINNEIERGFVEHWLLRLIFVSNCLLWPNDLAVLVKRCSSIQTGTLQDISSIR